ncbi:MAG TPA: von Willebrand factor type A domain-containing protein [Ferruginibacter sp.]|nr:von Willebrand factor type A domain-containing protein [Bacteroidota bacterium]HMT95140.1 von Willebrand factor type A domain-containing protein [Ferruginibacter sp.]HMU24635.1 von Willebrand factor type A domain-containing protein [Ferruginibacter sp.]
MKSLAAYCLLMLFACIAKGQYYLRGEVKDDKGNTLQNVKIFQHSTRSMYQTGPWGSFGIKSLLRTDSLTFTLDGYETSSQSFSHNQWQTVVLKASTVNSNKSKPRLISFSGNETNEGRFSSAFDNETYFKLVENDFVPALQYPKNSFSLNVNKASYSNVRRFINMQSKVPADAVKIEEMVNYFNLFYHKPYNNDLFNIETQLSSCPWNPNGQLLFLNVSARKLDLSKIPPANLVFLIDVSGSMDMPNRLPLLKAAFQLFVRNLRPIDQVSIVVYGGSVGVWLEPTSGIYKDSIARSIEQLTASGDTPGESAIRAAYNLARKTYIANGVNRVILATDGDFNVGEKSEEALEELITLQKQSGVYLTCLGVGMGNFKDSKLQTLAKKGNGNYAYIDDIMEAEKVLVQEITQTFYAVADDVVMNVEFNPLWVKQYRLIGFDNRRDAVTDPSSYIEGGEIGSGSSTLAMFELIPANQALADSQHIALIKLRYSLCNNPDVEYLSYPVNNNFETFNRLNNELKLATSIAMFGMQLRNSKYLGSTSWQMIYDVALQSANTSNFLQNEYLSLIQKADELYNGPKKKSRKNKKKD